MKEIEVYANTNAEALLFHRNNGNFDTAMNYKTVDKRETCDSHSTNTQLLHSMANKVKVKQFTHARAHRVAPRRIASYPP